MSGYLGSSSVSQGAERAVLIWMEGFSEALLFILGFSECRVIPADLGPMVVPTVDNPKVRELGVTLHLLLHSTGDTIPDAPAVYFCLSSDENIQRICQGLSSHLYGSYFFNRGPCSPAGHPCHAGQPHQPHPAAADHVRDGHVQGTEDV